MNNDGMSIDENWQAIANAWATATIHFLALCEGDALVVGMDSRGINVRFQPSLFSVPPHVADVLHAERPLVSDRVFEQFMRLVTETVLEIVNEERE